MKLVYAIVNSDDTYAVNKGFLKAGIRATKLSSTGGFLMSGNTTFLICCQDEEVDLVIDVCKQYSKKRKQYVPSSTIMEPDGGASYPVEVSIGGATIFVTDIERFEKV
ncbi:cyclic-di-AMP receptor [Ruminococcus sp.]|uniref:cyclic-di-AMP receptor n=1 Tax=Ruminococcus sp. TaxID=41978 RepID=UPI0025D4290F|nr:cyclic-di-AMP receptor [Ruminococcus sp.]